MGESQFEKLLKTLKAAERDRDLSRHTVDVQDKIINELRDELWRLREENEQLRELVSAGKGDRKAIDELVDQNLRLRGLVKEAFEEGYSDGTTDGHPLNANHKIEDRWTWSDVRGEVEDE